MDIVPLKSSNLQFRRPKRDAVRRHTTEVSFDQLHGRALSELERDTITSLSTENLSGESYNGDGIHNGSGKISSEQSSLNSSWSSLFEGAFDTVATDSSYCYVGSQEDAFKELNEMPKNKNHLGVTARHQYQLSYELALDNMLTPFISSHPPIISPLASSSVSKSKDSSLNPRHVIDEMVTTEQSYIKDLTDIIDGYLFPFKRKLGLLPLQEKDIDDLFGNVLEIRDFHQTLLHLLFQGGHHPGKIATCFLQQADGFNIYTHYCNNYPRSVHTLKKISKDSDIATFLRGCQLRLHHMLPLDAFLLKPVQRVLKYSLLLYEMGKRTPIHSDNYEVVQHAVDKMTDVAKHINAMKRKYEMAVHVGEVQSLMRGDWTGLDLTKYGDLMLEENLRYAHYTGKNARFRTERYVFLFQQLCLITKREEDDYFYYKAHIEMADLQLTEKVDKLPHCFQLRQVSTGRSHTFLTNSQRSKDMWVRSIKTLLVESIPHLPDKTRQLIMKGFDVTQGDSPDRKRRSRHHSEEPKKLHGVFRHQSGRSSLDFTNNKSFTLGLASSQGSDKLKKRWSTLPSTSNKLLLSLTPSSVYNLSGGQATTAIGISHPNNPLSSGSPVAGLVSVSEGNELQHELPNKLDAGSEAEVILHEDTNETDTVQNTDNRLQPEGFSLPNECQDELPDIANVIIPPPVMYHTQQLPSLTNEAGVCEIQSTNHTQSGRVFTDEEETFFDELMSNRGSSCVSEIHHEGFENSDTKSHAGIVDDHLPSSCDKSIHTNELFYCDHSNERNDDDDTTPQASPSTIKKWSLKKTNTNRDTFEGMVPISAANSCVDRPQSPSSQTFKPEKDLSATLNDPFTSFQHHSPGSNDYCSTAQLSPQRNSVTHRRHSFCGGMDNKPAHYHQNSQSTESTPKIKRCTIIGCDDASSPYFFGNQDSLAERMIHSSDQEPKIDAISLRSPLEFVDNSKLSCNLSVVNSPSNDHQSPNTFPKVNVDTHSSNQECSSHDTINQSSIQVENPVSIVTPYESNPEEMMSFTEILTSFDDYASTTGKTTKSSKSLIKLRSQSPETKRRKQKKKKRSQTVAGIDADTMNQVKEELEHRNQSRQSFLRPQKDSKVRQLPQDYSRKNKDYERSRVFRRFSAVVEEPSLSNAERDPDWLQQMGVQKDRSIQIEATTCTIKSDEECKSEVLLTSNEGVLYGRSQLKAKSNDIDDSYADDEQQRRSGFKGWVRSLVDKISSGGSIREK